MKKALTYTLAATLLMASLTACGNQVDDKQANSSDVTIEYGEVNSAKENEPTEVMSTAEMYKIFEEVYANRKSSKIDESELSAIKSKAAEINKLLPGDYEFQYIAWRPVTDHSQLDQYFEMKSEKKTLKVDVTIYDDFSDDAPQLGQFTKNTEVTILGTGIHGTDAEGWLSISSGLTDSPFFIKNGDLFEEPANPEEPAKPEPAQAEVKKQDPVKPQKPAKQEPAQPKQEPAKQEPAVQEPAGTFVGEPLDRVKENPGRVIEPDPNIEQGPQLDPNDLPDWISIG